MKWALPVVCAVYLCVGQRGGCRRPATSGMDLVRYLQPFQSLAHPLGTDQLGRVF
jgi:hypothetical protein